MTEERGCQCDQCRKDRRRYSESSFEYLDARDPNVRYNLRYWEELERYQRAHWGENDNIDGYD